LRNEVGVLHEIGSVFTVKHLKIGTWFAQKIGSALTTKECPVDNNHRAKKLENHVQNFKFKLDNNKIRYVID
jgi:hypothetical protein